MRFVLFGAMALAVISMAAFAQPQPEPKEPPAVVALIEDDNAWFMKQLHNDGSVDATQIRTEYRDVYSGVASIRVTPFQRFSARIPNWNYPIVEKPGPGQYRYLRFAWKRLGGDGIMVQLHSNGSWNQRYYAGRRSDQTAGWGAMMQVDPNAPREWTVVTRDLFKDWGAMTLQGFALTTMENGDAGLFDHAYLGRSIEDLDRASAQAVGRTERKDALTREQMDKLWIDLARDDVKSASSAFRTFVAGRKESVAYLAQKSKARPIGVDDKQVRRWIQDLDDEIFAVREEAYRAIDKLGDGAIKYLQAARAKVQSVEHGSRIESLLKNRGVVDGQLTGEQLRWVRAGRILEWCGTSEALETLEALVEDCPEPAVIADLKAARERAGKTIKR